MGDVTGECMSGGRHWRMYEWGTSLENVSEWGTSLENV